MATIQDSLEIAVKGSSHTASNGTRTVQPQKRKNVHPLNTSRSSNDQENTPLLENTQRSVGCFEKVRTKYNSRRCCLCSSRAAILILVWNAIVSFGLLSFLDPSMYMNMSFRLFDNNWFVTLIVAASTYSFCAFLYLFYPLAGWLADIRWGRHKTVVKGLCIILCCSIPLVLIGGGFALVYFLYYSNLVSDTVFTTVSFITAALATVIGFPCLILVFASLIAFSANVIQFGMDQLHDSPTDHSVLYVHWYVWTVYVGYLIVRIPYALVMVHALEIINFIIAFYVTTVPLALTLLLITLLIHRCKVASWFLIDSGSRNPYKLVWKVIKFAKEHSHPIRRSAFTYCEDELPSRLDLGKEKYGGPFTTEEVENVKAFWGILFILLTLGPVFLVDFAASGIVPLIVETGGFLTSDLSSAFQFYGSGIITPLIVVIIIPLYLGLLRPFIHDYIPGMLKRMGLGMILLFISGACTLVVASTRLKQQGCTDSEYYYNCSVVPLNYDANFFLVPSILNAFGYMFLYIASYEFICAQSPHSMKGLLIGTFFAIKGVFQLMGVLVIFTPITAVCGAQYVTFPGLCGFIYCLINTLIALVGIVAFIIVSRRYQYRQRDEPDNIYRYAEEYYANTQDEPNYDYDDYDNLNCETIQ